MQERQRAILATAVLADSFSVTYARLREVFGSSPADGTLRTHVSRLRSALGADAVPDTQDRIVHLCIPKENIDYWQLRRLSARAKGMLPQERVVPLREASALWTGQDPLSNVGAVRLDAEIEDLNDLGRRAFADLIRTELLLEEAEAATVSAASAVEFWRADEELAGLLWKALAMVGRSHDIRRDVEKLERAVSRNGGSLSKEIRREARDLEALALTRDCEARPTHSPVPRQLPMASATPVHGRAAELARLDALRAEETGPRLATVSGMPGVGKTQLTTYWARTSEHHFPDGTLYADLHGYSANEPQAVEGVLARFIRALRGDPRQLSGDELTAEYRSLVSERSALVILDNALSLDHVRSLLATGARNMTVVTSRSRLLTPDTIAQVRDIVLAPVELEAGFEILRHTAGSDLVDSDSFAARALARRCGGLPLALTLVGSQARRRHPHGLKFLAEELDAGRLLMDIGASAGTAGLREVVDWSMKTLTPQARRVLQVMAVHPGPSVRADQLSYLADLSTHETLRAVDQLLDSSLAIAAPPNRFALHDVIRERLTDLVPGAEATIDVTCVRDRLLGYLLWAGVIADKALNSGRELPVPAPDPNAPLPELKDEKAAMVWFDQEHTTFLNVLRSPAYDQQPFNWLLPAVLCAYQTRAGHWTAAEGLLKSARDADKSTLADPERLWADAVTLRLLALIQRKRGLLEPAAKNLESSILRCQEGRFGLDEAHAHQLLSVVREDLGQWDSVVTHSTMACELYQEHQDHRGVAHALNSLISIDLGNGEPERAIARGPAALSAAEHARDNYGMGAIHRNLVRCLQELDRHTEAISHAEAAIRLYELGAPANEAHVQAQLAESYRRLGRRAEQRSAVERAVALLDRLTDKRDRDRELLRELKHDLALLGCGDS
jgi:tetratricopeptide (TPR) repeat protein